MYQYIYSRSVFNKYRHQWSHLFCLVSSASIIDARREKTRHPHAKTGYYLTQRYTKRALIERTLAADAGISQVYTPCSPAHRLLGVIAALCRKKASRVVPFFVAAFLYRAVLCLWSVAPPLPVCLAYACILVCVKCSSASPCVQKV